MAAIPIGTSNITESHKTARNQRVSRWVKSSVIREDTACYGLSVFNLCTGLAAVKLTKTLIEGTHAEDKDVFLWCSELPRFGVRVAVSGRKTYIARYRTEAGQSRMVTLARTSDMPPTQARELARRLFAEVAGGGDPSAVKQAKRNAPTVAELYERYEREYAKPYKKGASVVRDETLWRLHILPAIGTRPIDSVTASDITALHVAMRDKAISANRVLSLLSHAFNMARRWKLTNSPNPVCDIPRYREKHRDRILTEEEVVRLHLALSDPITNPSFALLVRLLLLTGCRLNEIMSARVEWVDWARGLLLLPDSKTGQRRIFLPTAALKLIEPRQGEEWIIEGQRSKTHLKRPHRTWLRLCKRAGIEGVRLHDLRHTAASRLHILGATQADIAAILGHKQLSTTARYLHSSDDRKAVMLERLSENLG